jgi:hypothetical protein
MQAPMMLRQQRHQLLARCDAIFLLITVIDYFRHFIFRQPPNSRELPLLRQLIFIAFIIRQTASLADYSHFQPEITLHYAEYYASRMATDSHQPRWLSSHWLRFSRQIAYAITPYFQLCCIASFTLSFSRFDNSCRQPDSYAFAAEAIFHTIYISS